MHCKKIRKNIPSYLDNELRAATMEGMRAHFSNCRKCANILKKFRRLYPLHTEADKMMAPPFLWTRIEAQIDTWEKSQTGWHRWSRRIYAPVRKTGYVVIAGIAILAGILIGNFATSPSAPIEYTAGAESFITAFNPLTPNSIEAAYTSFTFNAEGDGS